MTSSLAGAGSFPPTISFGFWQVLVLVLLLWCSAVEVGDQSTARILLGELLYYAYHEVRIRFIIHLAESYASTRPCDSSLSQPIFTHPRRRVE